MLRCMSMDQKPCRRDELPLFLVTTLEPFEKWEIDFVGPSILPHASDGCTILLLPLNI
jgi:hypothetical protein